MEGGLSLEVDELDSIGQALVACAEEVRKLSSSFAAASTLPP